MKRILTLLFIPIISFSQGEQRYADGTATDQDGNTFEWINYGDYDWSIKNAEVVTYRDGTVIPRVTDRNEWANLTTGAWNYVNNNPDGGKVYNWYAVAGIHDNDATTPNKNLAPEGWRVPYTEFTFLRNFLIENGYTNDGTSGNNNIAKSMASTTGWQTLCYAEIEEVGCNQSTNNASGFNAKPLGIIEVNGGANFVGQGAVFWESFLSRGEFLAQNIDIYYDRGYIKNYTTDKRKGFSVRFVRDASAASTKDYSNAITIYPNPTTSIVTVKGGKQYDIEVYDIVGNKVMALSGNTINMAHLSTATYIVNAIDKETNEKLSYKVIKN